MSKNLISIAILLVLVTGCAPGSSVEVDVPSSTVVLTTPGPNPEQNKEDAAGRVAGVAEGLWHGLIAPVTLIGSFFNPTMEMYEVALVFLILGLIGGRRR